MARTRTASCPHLRRSLVVFQKRGRHRSPRGAVETAIRPTYDLFSHRQSGGLSGFQPGMAKASPESRFRYEEYLQQTTISISKDRGMRSMANDRANLRAICSPTSAMMDGIWRHGLCEASSPVTPRHQLECKSNALTLGYCRATRPIQSHPGVAGVHDVFSLQPLSASSSPTLPETRKEQVENKQTADGYFPKLKIGCLDFPRATELNYGFFLSHVCFSNA